MKKLIILLFALVGPLAAQTTVSGIWQGVGSIANTKYVSGEPLKAQMTLLQAGSSVTGTLQFGKGRLLTISSGTVSGNQVNFATTFKGASAGTGSLTVTSSGLQGKITSSKGRVLVIAFKKE